MIAFGQETAETKLIEDAVRPQFSDVHVNRYNSASIRIRIIDERFRGKSRVERDRMIDPLLTTLPEDTQADITILLLLAPEEAKNSLLNLEFEQPTPSRL